MRTKVWAVVGLVGIGDWLFFGRPVGVSLAVFAIGLVGVVLALRGDGITRNDWWVLGGVLLAVLPVVEKIQILSLAFLVGGVAIGTVAIWLGSGAMERWVVVAMRMVVAIPWRGPTDIWAARYNAVPRVHVGHWMMPVTVTAVFAALIIASNPLLEHWIISFSAMSYDSIGLAKRLVFWMAMATLIWPLLVAERAASWQAPVITVRGVPLTAIGFTGASVVRALVLFNTLFAIQTGLDAAYLWGGAALPDGMSHAAYAHRGAYPLLATALLAGVFALATRPFLSQGRMLRALLILWLVQNVMLVASSLLRLDLYVGAYGLTYLRIAAGIWMGLVATGLGLIAWQVWTERSNGWLIATNAGVGLVVLYLSCFVNFAALIANDGQARIAAGQRIDMVYLCALGADAAAHLPTDCGRVELPVITGWRDWGFRAARIRGRFPAVAQADE